MAHGAAGQPLAGVRVLLKSPDLGQLQDIRETLRGAGAQVVTAASPQEAFDAFQAHPPHVLVSDLDGPHAPDLRLIRQVRGLRQAGAVPAVALSALPWEEHRSAALAAGFSQWISKPAVHAVVHVIAGLLGRSANTSARSRRGAAPSAADLLTDVAVVPVSETIRRLWREGRSGDLFVRSHKAARMVFFEGGRIVFAASNVKKERLGEALIDLRSISVDDFHRASRLVAERRVRFGDALVAAGVMNKEDLGGSIVRWIERTVVSLFDLKTGSAFFEERACAIPAEYRVDLGCDRVLHAGIRTMSRHDLVLDALGSLDRRVVAVVEPPFPLEGEEQEILGLARSPMTVRRLAWTSGGLSPERARAVYALVAAGVLGEPGKTVARTEPPRAAPTPAAASAPPASVDPAVRKRIREELARSESLDVETWLTLPAAAPKDVLVRALEERKQSYEALRPADAELTTDLELLMGRVSMALRLARRPAAPPPPSVPAPSAPAPTTAATLAEAPAASMEVEHLLMEAGIRLSVGDYANAVRTYTRLVQLQPNVADHYLRLGIAMSRSPRTARQAEAELQEAVRLDPKNAEIRFQLGLYYKARNVRSRAAAEFKTAVQLDPRHKKAQAELAAAAPQESALGSLKKLLG